MKMNTRHFGEIEFKDEAIITFKEGIPGFKELTKYIIIEDPEETFIYLQSVEDEKLSFVTINPYILKKDYSINIKQSYIESLGGGNPEDLVVTVIANVQDEFEHSTVNLVAPIIIQSETKLGMQVILEETKYTTKHRLKDLLLEKEENVC